MAGSASIDASLGCPCYTCALTQQERDRRLYVAGERQGRKRLDVDALRRAIYVVSVRHDWENVVDRTDRTDEIAAEYEAILSDVSVTSSGS